MLNLVILMMIYTAAEASGAEPKYDYKVCQYAQSLDQQELKCNSVERALNAEYPSHTPREIAKIAKTVNDLFDGASQRKRAIESQLGKLRPGESNHDGRRLRVTHSKTHGCVRGTFTVSEKVLMPALRVGFFKEPGASFPVWARFANGTSFVRSDDPAEDGDARSLSFKVIGAAPGQPRLFRGQPNVNTMDFVMNNAPTFFIKSPRDFHAFFDGVLNPKHTAKEMDPLKKQLKEGEINLKEFARQAAEISGAYKKDFFSGWFGINKLTALNNMRKYGHVKVPVEIKDTVMARQLMHKRSDEWNALMRIQNHRPKNLLSDRYWSGVAINWGGYAVKYSLIPTQCKDEKKFDLSGAQIKRDQYNYYREVMEAQLNRRKAPACWDFAVQLQMDPWTMPIEDATIEWNEDKSPFFTVGQLRLDPQVVKNSKKIEFCDSLSFSNWRVTEDFRPLGDLNKLRREAYYISSQRRRDQNRQSSAEPTGEERF